jgi:hypothetical protein
VKPIRFTRRSRRHRIGKASACHVIATIPATVSIDPSTGAETLTWIGEDERGRELEIVALDRPDCLLVIHVMPTHYRRNKP